MTIRWIALTFTILAAVGCSGIKVSQDYDPATDFRYMQTFSWASDTQEKTGDLRIDNPLQDARIREAVESLLREKGFKEAVDASADFLVRYQYTLRRKIDSDGTGGGIGFGIGSYGSHGGIAIGTGNSIREYDEGTLTIDVIDAESKALLWRGSGSQRVTEYSDPAESSRDIHEWVEKILNPFPPQDE